MKLNKSIHTRDSDSFSRKTLQQYKDDYLDILEYYKSKYIDNDEVSFIDYEIRLIKEYIKPVLENIKTELEIKGVLDLEIELNVKPFIPSYSKIISFLETKKSELEVTPEPESFAEIDLSDSSGVQKIIYLNELGIIDFLRTKTKAGISNGGLASVLSGITGLKPGTIKSSLNRLSNKDIADHRHPYYTKKTVDKIKKNLNDLGF